MAKKTKKQKQTTVESFLEEVDALEAKYELYIVVEEGQLAVKSSETGEVHYVG